MKKIFTLLVLFLVAFMAFGCGKNNPQEDPCANGHTFGDWKVVVAAECEKKGSEERKCSVCGKTETQEIAALEHNYVDGKCSLCGKDDPNFVKVMTFEEFNKAEVGDDVCIEAYVQDFESFWNGQTIYLADKDGNPYFGYTLGISEEDSQKLEIGTPLHIEGKKLEYDGMVEIGETTKVSIMEGEKFVAPAMNVTNVLSNEYALGIPGAKIEVYGQLFLSKDKAENDVAFLYNWDGNGEAGKSDLYIKFNIQGQTYTFNVRRYLRGADSEVYKFIEVLTNMEEDYWYKVTAFVYNYKGECQARIIDMAESSQKEMFDAAEIGDDVVIEAYVQDFESWWNNKQTLYLVDEMGDAYFGYDLPIGEDLKDSIKAGLKLHIEGKKLEYSGMVEISEATKVEIATLDDTMTITPSDITGSFSNEYALANPGAPFKMYVKLAPSKDKDGADIPFMYNWDGTGEAGKSDIYFNVDVRGDIYTFNVRRYLRDANSDVYKFLQSLTNDDLGDWFYIEGYIYNYKGACQARIVYMEHSTQYDMFYKAQVGDDVIIEAYVQDFESWWNGKQTLYLADKMGAYFGYDLGISEDDSKKITFGTKVTISGKKLEYSGMVEIGESSSVVVDKDATPYIVSPIDVTAGLTNELALENPGLLIRATATLVLSKDKDGIDVPFIYNWDGKGEAGKSDIYVKLEINNQVFTFNVRRYLRSADTEVYKYLQSLTLDDAGNDFIVTAFIYNYKGECQARIVGFEEKPGK